MKIEALKKILQSPYKKESWVSILRFLTGEKEVLNISLESKEILLNTEKQKHIVTRLSQLGVFTTTDGIPLPIYEIELQANIKIEYNRVGVNDLIKEFILKDAQQGAIATYFYTQSEPAEWRFSFISKQSASDFFEEVQSKETNPKKYTYIFGTADEHRTAIERLYNLQQSALQLEDFFEAFNVEPVSKNFFKEYKNFYLDFIHHLSSTQNRKVFDKDIQLSNKEEKNEKIELEIRNFVKRLLGRLVFLYFLQKKNWLGATTPSYTDGDPNFLQNLFSGKYGTINQEEFYGEILSRLFFNTLNTAQRSEDHFVLPDNSTLRIPYLNGGLFEEEQEPEDHRKLKIAAYLFESLFAFFNEYNFTIYENSPEDHIIAVDPEMLGHIFENLLEDNTDKGAFYTPKEIVHYMTQESLIEYLHTKTDFDKEDIRTLVVHQQNDAFVREELIAIEKHLDQVKVCDPAIGSGAFPMGLLQEIFALKALIHFRLGYEIWSPAKVKQDIIQNSIYGVDIEPGAVDIARLRFWLSLVVDEPTPKPLPNLDYKIMQGNSLVEEFAGIDLSKIMDEGGEEMLSEQQTFDFGDEFKTEITIFDSASKADFQKLLNQYFNPDEWEKNHREKIDKIAIRKKINDFVEGKIHAIIFRKKRVIQDHIQQFEFEHYIQSEEDYQKLNQKSVQFKKYLAYKKRLIEIDNIEEQLIEFQSTDVRPYFLWHVFFADVFDQGGFDIVIGNPPYIKEYTNRSAFDTFRKSEYYQGKMDIWYGFACQGVDKLKEKGVLSFIATNNWTTNSGASKMRKKITAETQIVNLVDFNNYKIFESAGIQTMIMLFKKDANHSEYTFDYRKIIEQEPRFRDVVDILNRKKTDHNQIYTYSFERSEFVNKPLIFNPPTIKNILNIIKKKGELFLLDSEVANGIHPHHDFVNKKMQKLLGENYKVGDGIFALSDEEMKSLNLTKEESLLIKPYYSTSNFSKYYANPDNKFWLIYTGSEFKYRKNILPYPNIKQHLDKFQKVITSDNRPYGLHRARKEEFFQDEKIIVQRKCPNEPVFTYTDFDTYVSATFYVIKTERISQKYLTALLNSKLIAFWLRYKGKMQGNNYQIDKEPLINIPIFEIEDSSLFEMVVNIILHLKTPSTEALSPIINNPQIALYFEEIINAMVYELYFEEEMKAKELCVTELIQKEIKKVFGDSIFENRDLSLENEKIWEFFNNLKNSELQKRMRLFVTKSPDILKPIIQH